METRFNADTQRKISASCWGGKQRGGIGAWWDLISSRLFSGLQPVPLSFMSLPVPCFDPGGRSSDFQRGLSCFSGLFRCERRFPLWPVWLVLEYLGEVKKTCYCGFCGLVGVDALKKMLTRSLSGRKAVCFDSDRVHFSGA